MAAKRGVGKEKNTNRLESGRRLPAFFGADRRRVVLNGVVVIVAERFRAAPLQLRRHVAQNHAPGRWRESDPCQRAARWHARIADQTRRTSRRRAGRRRVDDRSDEQPWRQDPGGRHHEPRN